MAITNLGEAQWLNEGPGAVCVTANAIKIPLPAPVNHLSSATLKEVVFAPVGVHEATDMVVSFAVEGRTPFGEKHTVKLVPIAP